MATISEVGSEPGDDDDDNGTDTTDNGTDTTGTNTTTATATEPRSWSGERNFFFDWCEDTIFGDGVEVTQDEDYADALAACPECDEIYAVDHSPETICFGYISVNQFSIRGVNRTTGAIYDIKDDGGFEANELATGDWDGNTLEYNYVVDDGWGDYEVDGWATAE